ncbi:hypothetical protein JDS99_04645 [Bacillus cereus group sp. N6]|uniref:hypothetical protein n=1 Tax=Bacillus cereus group sp. N6 TaxID=2794583 RepID=UPI0018F27987|nr:hypothetical protein [Bacillus cereus group sp. N6]MBJ8108952.1 hypothetical protein [Bacillus cereus group sp. N6]
MKTKSKLDYIFEAILNADKDELMDVVKGLNKAEIKEMAEVVAVFRDASRKIPTAQTVEIILPIKEDIQEEISDEEHKELEEKYGERAKAPQSEFIKYEGPQQLYDLLMKDKKEKGWKFKNEK